MISLELGGIVIPQAQTLELGQSYEPISGSSLSRMMAGNGRKQTNWTRLRTTITGNGWTPAGLAALDYSQPLLMRCAAPRAVTSLSNVLTLPQERRSDAGAEPTAWGNLADGSQVSTTYGLVGDTLTATPVPGAVSYTANYYPEITVFSDGPGEDDNLTGASYDWSLTAEEV